MHIGGLTIIEGPPPSMEEFLEQIRRRLHLVPRYRHKLAYTALDSGRPVWIDDPSFNLEYHVRHTALPAPGQWEQLQDLTARIFSQQLDRSKPLWEMWLIEGLRGRPLRADHQDPPLADRRHRGRRSGDGAVRPLARPAADRRLRARRGSPHPEPGHRAPARRRPARRGARGRDAGGGRDRRARAPRARAVARSRGGRGRRRDRMGGPEPGAGNAAERADRPAPALRRGSPASSRTSRRSRTPSAAPSTTSCWRSSRARCARS